MKLRIYDPRILALDIRHRRFGFAVFEGHRNLLGWGTRVYPAVGEEETAMMGKRLVSLIELYAPSVIVTTHEHWDCNRVTESVRSLEGELLGIAGMHRISVQAISKNQVRESFLNLACDTKYQIATAISRIYPELLPKLPPPRRLWESEHSSLIVFESVALGMAYWQHPTISVFEPDKQSA